MDGRADLAEAVQTQHTFGASLKELREHAGLSQHTLERELKRANVAISDTTLHRFETGKAWPDEQQLLHICRACGAEDRHDELQAQLRRERDQPVRAPAPAPVGFGTMA